MRRIHLIVGATIALLLVAGAAVASIPGPDGVIHGCRKNTDGSLRVIDSATTCPNGYTALNWSQGGVAGYEQVFLNQPGPFLAGVVRDVTVSCPPGKVALGGGFDVSNGGAGAGASILASWPSGGSSSSWNVRVQPTTELDYVTAFVTCGNAS